MSCTITSNLLFLCQKWENISRNNGCDVLFRKNSAGIPSHDHVLNAFNEIFLIFKCIRRNLPAS